MVAIDQIQRLLKQIPNEGGQKSPFSFIEICCTNSTLLAFDGSQAFPKYVVRLGDEASLSAYWGKLTTLGRLLPGTIPSAVCLNQVSQSQWALVQAGVPGSPWFTLTSRMRNANESELLISSSLGVLRDFHAAVNSQPSWRDELVVADAFRRVVEQTRAGGIDLPQPVELELVRTENALRELGSLRCHWQHGDFCLNNLVFDQHKTFLLDFDDFGHSSFPLLDQIGLAYSISERIANKSFWKILKTTATQSQFPEFDDRHLRAFVVCHLMNALAGTIGIGRRRARQTHVLQLLNSIDAGTSLGSK